jgi:hypothetical protein
VDWKGDFWSVIQSQSSGNVFGTVEGELARLALLANLGQPLYNGRLEGFACIWIEEKVLQGFFYDLLNQGAELLKGEVFDLHGVFGRGSGAGS